MKFRCERDTLAEAIGAAQRAVSARGGALPVLGGVQVTAANGNLTLVGTDLDLTVKVRIPADVETEGEAVVPGKLFDGLVARLKPGTVSFEIEGDDAKITGGSAHLAIRLLPTAEFPRIVVPEGASVTVAAEPFAEALRQVIPAASRDDARPVLTGVLLAATSHGMRLVATDSYRLAVRDLAGVSMLNEGQRVLVGAKGLAEVQRLFGDSEIAVVLGDRDVSFSSETRTVIVRRIEGEYPNYEQLIPSHYPNRMTVSRAALEEAVKLMQTVGEGRDSTPVKLAMSAAGLELSANAQERADAQEMIDAKFEGSELAVAFNPQFLLDGLAAVGSEDAVLETLDPLKPATLRPTDRDDFLYLLMPVRIT